jgi:hypothetical protein
LKLEPVVLSEQPDLGLTIVEKLEHYGKDCDFALVLLTADDQTASGGQRARQNVIHELGYFHGRLGRNRVLLLKEADVELFSNISGLIYKEFPRGSVQAVFEHVRLAIESGDASPHAVSVPRQKESESADFLHEVLGQFTKSTASIARETKDTLLRKLTSLADTLPAEVKLSRLRAILDSEHTLWKDRADRENREIQAAGSTPAETLRKVMSRAGHGQFEDIERSLSERISIFDSWQAHDSNVAQWISDAIKEVKEVLKR